MGQLTPEPRSKRDRRLEPRSAASGPVEISFEDPLPATVPAELVAASASGFRVVHKSPALVPGLEIRFKREGATGRARVVWTQVRGENRASGLLVL